MEKLNIICILLQTLPTYKMSVVVLGSIIIAHKGIKASLCGRVFPITESKMPSVN